MLKFSHILKSCKFNFVRNVNSSIEPFAGWRELKEKSSRTPLWYTFDSKVSGTKNAAVSEIIEMLIDWQRLGGGRQRLIRARSYIAEHGVLLVLSTVTCLFSR